MYNERKDFFVSKERRTKSHIATFEETFVARVAKLKNVVQSLEREIDQGERQAGRRRRR